MYDDQFCLRRYRELCESEPAFFANPPDCPTNILLDPDQIRAAQRAVTQERSAAGFATRDVRVGLLAEDLYIGYVIRDAVKFSDGRYGLYNRVVVPGGIIILPIMGDSIALIRIFRHSPRRWFLEVPQGLIHPGDDPEAEARRELMEEMGAEAKEMIPLGQLYTSTALSSENLDVFAARIEATGKPQLSEGIDSIHLVPKGDIDRRLLDGTICDGPTTTVIARARARGLL